MKVLILASFLFFAYLPLSQAILPVSQDEQEHVCRPIVVYACERAEKKVDLVSYFDVVANVVDCNGNLVRKISVSPNVSIYGYDCIHFIERLNN